MNADDLAKLLDELGQRLGPTGEHVVALAVRQVYIDGFIGAIASGLGMVVVIVATIVLIRITVRRWNAEVADYKGGHGRVSYRSEPDSFYYVFPWAIGGLLGAMGFGALTTVFLTSLAALLNPEYAALRSILGAISR